MRRSTRRLLFGGALAPLLTMLLALGAPGLAAANDFPSKPVRIIVPFTPGGVGDVFARALGEIMAKELKQPVVVENKPGANQMLAASAVATAPPDGYLLYQATTTAMVNPLLYRKLPYDPKALKPLWIGIETPVIYVINPKIPATTLAEFAAWARANPAQANYSSIGAGNVLHLAAEKLKSSAKFEMTHIPYAGRSADAINAVIAGDVAMMATIVGQAVPLVKAGRVRALAVSSPKRLAGVTEVPTVAEAGFPALQISSWYGLYIHSATPEPIAAKLRAAADKALADPAFRERFASQGQVVLEPRSAAEVERYVEESSKSFGSVIREQNLVLD